MRTLTFTSILLVCFSVSPALALDGLAPAGPCAQAEEPVTGPVALLFSPQNVASAGGSTAKSASAPATKAFQGRDACSTGGGCGRLNERLPNPPVNPPGPGTTPPE